MADQIPVPSPGYYPDGAPTSYWVDCIWVDKVFGSCQKVVTANGTGTAPASCTTLTTVTCGTPSCTFLNSVPSADDFATLSWLVVVPVNYTCDSGSGTVTVTTQVVATIYSPSGTTPACIPFSVSCGAKYFKRDCVCDSDPLPRTQDSRTCPTPRSCLWLLRRATLWG